MSLNLKHRPKTFDDFIGQKELIAALRGMISSPERSHSYMFAGPAGCGKTTLGRILATEFDSSHDDIMEINAADLRGIDAMREVLAAVTARPFSGKSRTIILDEAHQLTKEAQNLLLKPVEEPPDYIYFIFCSTNHMKILKTIRSRCQLFEVRPLLDPEMALLLNKIYQAEQMEGMTADIANAIIRFAGGVPRDALLALEKANSVTNKEDVITLLRQGLIAEDPEVIELLRTIAGMNSPEWQHVVPLIQGLEKKLDAEAVRISAVNYFKSCLYGANAPAVQKKYEMMIEMIIEPMYTPGSAWADLVRGLSGCVRVRNSS